jgi:hypothetical protein
MRYELDFIAGLSTMHFVDAYLALRHPRDFAKRVTDNAKAESRDRFGGGKEDAEVAWTFAVSVIIGQKAKPLWQRGASSRVQYRRSDKGPGIEPAKHLVRIRL